MSKKPAVTKKRGRPKTIDASTMIALRLPDPMVEAIDGRAKVSGVGRSEAARRLLELGLKARGKAR